MNVKQLDFENVSDRFAGDRARRATAWINKRKAFLDKAVTLRNVFFTTVLVLLGVYVACRIIWGW
jgi:hypothetical protein